MGFLERKGSKKNKIPDLSRYNNQPPQDYNYLSTNAANQAIRTYSLGSGSNQRFANPNAGYFGERSNSITRDSQNNGFGNIAAGYRSNSISGYGNYRSNSITSNSQRTNSLRNNSLRQNSLRDATADENTTIVHTIKTIDEYGRLKSITTETIRKMGSFELTKTETKNIPLRKKSSFEGNLSPPMVKYANSITSSSHELESIAEDDEVKFPGFQRGVCGNQQDVIKEENGGNSNSDDIIEEGDESGDSIYSDAFDMIPKDISKEKTQKTVDQKTEIPKLQVDQEVETPQNQSPNLQSPEVQSPQSQPSQLSSIIKTNSIISNKTKPKTKKRVSIEDNVSILSNDSKMSKGSKYKDYSVNYWQNNNQPNHTLKKQISDQEMYDKAYKLALGKVYGDTNPTPVPNNNNVPIRSQKFNIQPQPYQQQKNKENKETHPYKKLSHSQSQGFKRHSMRQSVVIDGNPDHHNGSNHKNYNYQLNNKFGSSVVDGKEETPSEETAVDIETDKIKGKENNKGSSKKGKKKFNLFKLFKIKT